ncbi:DPH4 homolog [Drosophila grimshawi]|uniref:GH17525 n=1 Tax=Drosophila grimshawi TaxID=7222 RepID=B4JST7_DROGR|nr:DPH4 homolog [Drosophila grimshawi]EDV94827.1 GH17525 [Drosophila grimshawi]
MSNLNFYELLNANATATFEELKRNYKQLILQCHPDKLQQQAVTVNFNESDPNRESHHDSNFNAINEAWNTLKDPIKRKHYDAELLQTKFQTEHNNMYASITFNDMQRMPVEILEEEQGEEKDGENTNIDKDWNFAYAYNCRCGGQYLLDESQRREELEERAASEMIVECSECSLVIVVKHQTNKP